MADEEKPPATQPAPVAAPAEPAPAPAEKPTETPPAAPPKIDPTAELAALRTTLEEMSSKLSTLEAAAVSPGTDPTEAEAVLKARWEADLATLPAEQQAALKEIAGDSVLVGVKALTALQKAGMVGSTPNAQESAPPSDRQNLDAGGKPTAPASFDEASARIAANLGNMRL